MDDRFSTLSLAAEAVSDQTQWILIAVGSAFMLYILLRPWINGRRKRPTDPLTDQPFKTSLAQQKALERDMQCLLVELHNMARQMSSQIETRVAKLELLLEEADAKIARLESGTGRGAVGPSGDGQAGSAFNATDYDRPPLRLATNDDAESDGGTTEDATTAKSTATTATSAKPTTSADRYAELYRLADEGLDARAIAARVQRPLGEIELILALRPRVRAAPDAPDVEVTEPPAIATA